MTSLKEKSQVKEVILDFNQELYSENELWRPTASFEGLGSLTSEEKIALELTFEEEEILNAINLCAPDKSSGPDGFSIGIYQK